MTRGEAYLIIDSERQYQVDQADKDNSHVVSEFPLSSTMEAIKYNLDLCNKSWYNEKAPYPYSMNHIRKIAALCVQAMEKYGCEPRKIENNKFNFIDTSTTIRKQ